MTVIVTRNVSMRTRGFLASCMLEVASGVYVSPSMSKGVRERVWGVLQKWFPYESDAGITMVWQDNSVPCGISVSVLGEPPIELKEYNGFVLAWKDVTTFNYSLELDKKRGRDRR